MALSTQVPLAFVTTTEVPRTRQPVEPPPLKMNSSVVLPPVAAAR
jgi:hypothetical protein